MKELTQDLTEEFIIEKLNEKKGMDIKVIDVRGTSILSDYFIIATGLNKIHTKTLAENIIYNLPKDIYYSVEGMKSLEWILIDLGNIIVHIFTPDARDYYDIESIYKNREEEND